MEKSRIETNEKIAIAIKDFCIKHEVTSDMRIYFNGIAWDFGSDRKMKIIEDIKASDYFEFANNESVCVSSEGDLYHVINMTYGHTLYESLVKMLDEKFNVYFELGNAWNFTIVYDDE